MPIEPVESALESAFPDRDVAGSLPTGFDRRTPIYAPVWTLGYATVVDRLAAYRDESPESVAALIESTVDRQLDALAD